VNVLLASWQNEIIKDIGELISNFRRDVRKRLEEAQVSHELVVRHAQQLLIDEQMIFKIDPTLTLGDLKTIEEKLQSTLKDVPKLQEMKIKEFLKQSNEVCIVCLERNRTHIFSACCMISLFNVSFTLVQRRE